MSLQVVFQMHLKCICLNKTFLISVWISVIFLPVGLIDDKSALFQLMVWHRVGEKPLSSTQLWFLTFDRDFRISENDFRCEFVNSKKHCGRNIIDHGRSYGTEFVFHRNLSLSLLIFGIQIHSGELRSARAPMIYYAMIIYLIDAYAAPGLNFGQKTRHLPSPPNVYESYPIIPTFKVKVSPRYIFTI